MKSGVGAAAQGGMVVAGPTLQSALVAANLGRSRRSRARPPVPSKTPLLGAHEQGGDLRRVDDGARSARREMTLAQYTALTLTGAFFRSRAPAKSILAASLGSVNVALFSSSARTPGARSRRTTSTRGSLSLNMLASATRRRRRAGGTEADMARASRRRASLPTVLVVVYSPEHLGDATTTFFFCSATLDFFFDFFFAFDSARLVDGLLLRFLVVAAMMAKSPHSAAENRDSATLRSSLTNMKTWLSLDFLASNRSNKKAARSFRWSFMLSSLMITASGSFSATTFFSLAGAGGGRRRVVVREVLLFFLEVPGGDHRLLRCRTSASSSSQLSAMPRRIASCEELVRSRATAPAR